MSQTTLPIPINSATTVRDLADLADRVFAWARDVDDHLRTQPSIETLTVDIDPAGLPLTIACQTPASQVRAVARQQTVDKSDSALVSNVGLGWRQSSSSDGFEVSELPGCSAGTTYAVTFVVTGERG